MSQATPPNYGNFRVSYWKSGKSVSFKGFLVGRNVLNHFLFKVNNRTEVIPGGSIISVKQL